MSKKVYTEKDIYEGMVLECVYPMNGFWTEGKQYIVNLNALGYIIFDDYNIQHNVFTFFEQFKVVEPEEDHKVLQLFKYTFGLKIGDVEELSLWQGDTVIDKYLNVNKKHITIPAYNTQQAIEYLTNELEYDINDIVSMEVN